MKINIKEPKLKASLNIQKIYPSLEDLEVTATTQEQVFTHPNSYGYDIVTVNPISINLQDKTVTPSTSSQTITADEGYTALENVTVNAVTSDIDNNIVAGNIKNGVSILGVTGNVVELIGETITVNPITSQQVIQPRAGKNAITQVTVNAVTSSIDNNIIPSNIKDGVSILGVTGNISGDSFSKFIELGDNLRGKTIIISKDYTFHDFRDGDMKFILFNNTSVDDAENDDGDFIKKEDDLKQILFFSRDEGIEELFYDNANKLIAGYKFPDTKDYIVTYIDDEMNEIFKIGYLKFEDFEFEKVSSINIARGTNISGVEGNAPDEFDKFLDGTLASSGDYENPRITSMPNGMFSGGAFDSFNGVVSFPNVTQIGINTFYPANNITGLEFPKLLQNTSGSYIIMNCVKLKYIYTPDWAVSVSGPMRGNILCETIDFRTFAGDRTIGSYAFQNLTSLTKMIIRGTTLIAMTSTSNNLYGSPLFTGDGCLYVRPDLVSTYKTATNWSAMATRIYGFYLASSVEDITTKLNDNTIPVGSLIIYDGGSYETNRYTVKTGGN